MFLQSGEIAAQVELDIFAAAFPPPARSGNTSVVVYSAAERRLLSKFEVAEASSDLHLAFVGSDRPGVAVGAYLGSVAFHSLEGAPLWARGDIRKVHRIDVIRHASVGRLLGIWIEPRDYLVLDAAGGFTLGRVSSCTGMASDPDGSMLLAARGGSSVGAWMMDPSTLQPARRILPEQPDAIYPGDGSFLIVWHGGYATVDHLGNVLSRQTVRGVLGPAAWGDDGHWIVRDATVAPNAILAISPEGASRALSVLPSYAPNCALLARGGLLACSNGKVYNTSDGALEWDFAVAGERDTGAARDSEEPSVRLGI